MEENKVREHMGNYLYEEYRNGHPEINEDTSLEFYDFGNNSEIHYKHNGIGREVARVEHWVFMGMDLGRFVYFPKANVVIAHKQKDETP